MKKLILTEEDMNVLDQHILNLPNFAQNVGQTMAVSQAVQELFKFLQSKVVAQNEAVGELQS